VSETVLGGSGRNALLSTPQDEVIPGHDTYVRVRLRFWAVGTWHTVLVPTAPTKHRDSVRPGEGIGVPDCLDVCEVVDVYLS